MLRYLLDTNIFVAMTKRHTTLAARMREHPAGAFAMSVVVLQELYYGAYKSSVERRQGNLHNVEHMRFVVLDFTAQDAETAGRVRADLARVGTPIGPYDALIAAQALTRDLTLVTHNVREFSRVQGLRVEDWL